jgi:hypothetical protein
MTNMDGSFTVQCPPAGITTAILEVWSENDDVKVVDTDTARSNHYIPPAMVGGVAVDASSCASPVTMYVTSPRQAELFHNHQVAITQSRSIFGAAGTLPQVRAVIKRPYSIGAFTGPYGTETKPPGTMVDSITFREEDATGPYGQFIVAHEYAHAAHHVRLGGLTGFRRIDSCRPHAIGSINSMGCAAVEGFADFWATLTRWPTPASGSGGQVHHVYNDLSNNRFLYNDGNAPQDGSRVEGAVASFLLDLVDGVGTDTVRTPAYPGIVFADSLQLSPGLITGAVKECKVFTYFPPYPPDLSNHALLRSNGVDHWAYCLEQEMRRVVTYIYSISDCGGSAPIYCPYYDVNVAWDNRFFPGIADTYFQERRTAASWASWPLAWQGPQYPVAWQIGDNMPNPALSPRPEVRRLWLCNLYGERCTSRSVAAPFP